MNLLDAEADRSIYPRHLQRLSVEWTPPLHDFSVGDTWYKWFKLARQFDELDLIECGLPCPAPPAWESDEKDWHSLLQEMEENTDIIHNDWETWGLKQGVCPGQPFLVELAGPLVYGGSYYEPYDTEVEYAITIVRRMPRTHKDALRAWTRHRLAENIAIQKMLRRTLRRQKLCLGDPHKWKIHFTPWSLELSTSYNMGDRERRYVLASIGFNPIEATEKDKAVSFRKLVRSFLRSYPNAPIDHLLKLAPQIVPMDRYTRITLELQQSSQDHP